MMGCGEVKQVCVVGCYTVLKVDKSHDILH